MDRSTWAVLCEPPDLEAELCRLLRQIPPGRVTTYGILAEALGDRAAARWIGQYLTEHSHPPGPSYAQGDSAVLCPCHRVVRSDGSLGLYCGELPAAKKSLLEAEGVPVRGGRVPLAGYLFQDFRGPRVLEELRLLQQQVASAVRQAPLASPPRQIGAVDVAYCEQTAAGAYVLMDAEGEKILWGKTLSRPVKFPYISGFLAFRELPVLCELLQHAADAGQWPDVLLVDGSGIVHPRGVGIASHLGVALQIPTIGVTKSLLCGRLIATPEHPWITHRVVLSEKVVGFAFPASPRSKDLVYVCPGHLIDVPTCEKVVERLRRGHRLPEPLYWADRKSKEAVRPAGRS
jgi:deoxyribonuclease V